METREEKILSRRMTRRAAMSTGFRLATMVGTATAGAVALNAHLALPAHASGGLMTNYTPAGTVGGGGWYFVATGTNGGIFQYVYSSNTGWTEIPGGWRTPSAPAAAAVNNYAFVAVRGDNNYIYVNQGTPGGAFVGWQRDFAMQTDAAPSLTVNGNQFFLFAKRLDDRWVLGGGAAGWREVGSGGSTTTTPVASVVQNYMFVAVRGGDGNVYLNQGAVGGGFVGWQWAGITSDVAPALVTSGSTDTLLFVKDRLGYIFFTWWQLGGGGNGWVKLNDFSNSLTNLAPSVVVGETGQPNTVLITGTDGQIYWGWADRLQNGGWQLV